MPAEDGKNRETDTTDTEQLLRLIQSIPSPKAEPFKQWLAKVGYERMQEIADPAQSLDRARENWQKIFPLRSLQAVTLRTLRLKAVKIQKPQSTPRKYTQKTQRKNNYCRIFEE